MKARIFILLAALLFSSGGAAIKSISVGAWPVAGFRSLIAAVAVWLLMPAARRGYTWRTWLVGVAYASTMIAFVVANKLTTAAATIFLQSTAPLFILLLGPLLLREKIRSRDLLLMAPVAGGFVLLFMGTPAPTDSAPNPLLGNTIAALSGVAWAFTVVGLRWLGKPPEEEMPSTGATSVRRATAASQSAAPAIVAGNLIAAVVGVPIALAIMPAAPTATDWLLLGYLGVFQIGLAYVFLTLGLRNVPALEASLLLLLEPVLNPVQAWMVLGETPTPLSMAGGVLILAATAVRTIVSSRARRGVGDAGSGPRPAGRG